MPGIDLLWNPEAGELPAAVAAIDPFRLTFSLMRLGLTGENPLPPPPPPPPAVSISLNNNTDRLIASPHSCPENTPVHG